MPDCAVGVQPDPAVGRLQARCERRAGTPQDRCGRWWVLTRCPPGARSRPLRERPDSPEEGLGANVTLSRNPPRDRPLAQWCPEVLGAVPADPLLVALLAVAHQAAADQVLAHGEAAMHLGHHMIERRAAAKRIAAVGAAVVPCEVDLIARGAAGDQTGLINVMSIQGPAAGELSSHRSR